MKKALSLMTAAALVLSLAACGSTASSAASSDKHEQFGIFHSSDVYYKMYNFVLL